MIDIAKLCFSGVVSCKGLQIFFVRFLLYEKKLLSTRLLSESLWSPPLIHVKILTPKDDIRMMGPLGGGYVMRIELS